MTAENIEDDADIQYVRPISMTLISLWLLFSALTVVWLMFRGYGASSTVNSILLAVGGIVSLVCGVGFWLMKKWALYVYTAYGLINQVALLALGRWNIFSLLLLVIIVYVGFRYRSEMT
ncbi:MAG: hypothetical protein ACM3Y8_01690 [Byssovorax cruenta]